jgi:hypothetical protein
VFEMADFTWLIPSGGILALIILIGILVIWKTLKEKKSGYPLMADFRCSHGKQPKTMLLRIIFP